MGIVDRGRQLYRNVNFQRLLREKSAVSVSEAYDALQEFLPREAPCFSQENEIVPEFDVMIIVPVYNVEQYLDQCIDSVLGQKTKYSFQAVFVDDGSTDGSGEILKNRIKAPHVLITQNNSGVSVARNIALRHITGRYVMFLDSDDYLAPDAVERLVCEAESTGADIVEASHTFFNDKGDQWLYRHKEHAGPITRHEVYGFPWGKIIKSELLANFCFPVGYMFEDTVMSTLLYPQCGQVYALPDALYFYRDNSMGITHRSKVRKEAVDTFWITKYCLEERLRRGQTLDSVDYERYLTAAWRNYERTKKLPQKVQEWIFVLTCKMFEECLPFHYEGREKRMQMLEKTIRRKSYRGFCFLLARWDNI